MDQGVVDAAGPVAGLPQRAASVFEHLERGLYAMLSHVIGRRVAFQVWIRSCRPDTQRERRAGVLLNQLLQIADCLVITELPAWEVPLTPSLDCCQAVVFAAFRDSLWRNSKPLSSVCSRESPVQHLSEAGFAGLICSATSRLEFCLRRKGAPDLIIEPNGAPRRWERFRKSANQLGGLVRPESDSEQVVRHLFRGDHATLHELCHCSDSADGTWVLARARGRTRLTASRSGCRP